MEAAKAVDAYGLFVGHATEQTDAEQAYTQSKLGGTPTWVRLPRERWPPAWKSMVDPVCPLRLSLYGHADSGGVLGEVLQCPHGPNRVQTSTRLAQPVLPPGAKTPAGHLCR